MNASQIPLYLQNEIHTPKRGVDFFRSIYEKINILEKAF